MMSENWDFYFSRVNDKVASIYTDLGLHSSIPDAKRPWLLWVWVYFNEPREDGMTTSAEAEILWDIGDALDAAVEAGTGASLVGRITSDGHREFMFYGESFAGFDDAVARGMKAFPNYKFESGNKHDPDWSVYRDLLYPSERDRQRIKNRHVVEALKKEGDALTKKRPVFHWIYFEARKGRAAFKAAVEKLGFKVLNESNREDSSSYSWSIQLERDDLVDWESVNDVTLELFELAKANSGSYDGWETSVERD